MHNFCLVAVNFHHPKLLNPPTSFNMNLSFYEFRWSAQLGKPALRRCDGRWSKGVEYHMRGDYQMVATQINLQIGDTWRYSWWTNSGKSIEMVSLQCVSVNQPQLHHPVTHWSMPTKTRWAQQFRRSQQSEAIPKKGPDNSRGWKVDSRKRNPVEFSGIFRGFKAPNIVLKNSEWMWVFCYI